MVQIKITKGCPKCGCPIDKIEYKNCGPILRIQCSNSKCGYGMTEGVDAPLGQLVETWNSTADEYPNMKAGRAVKIWLDDVRPAPAGYELAKSVCEAKALIEQIEAEGGTIEVLDLDHDLGDYAQFGGDGIKLLYYLIERETFYQVKLHTANPVGRRNMQGMIDRYWP